MFAVENKDTGGGGEEDGGGSSGDGGGSGGGDATNVVEVAFVAWRDKLIIGDWFLCFPSPPRSGEEYPVYS